MTGAPAPCYVRAILAACAALSAFAAILIALAVRTDDDDTKRGRDL